jgi:hypothetical protein
MPSKIVVSRRIYVPVLILAIVLVALVIGSVVTRAQYLVEYPFITIFCRAADGTVTVPEVDDDGNVECEAGEEPLPIMNYLIYDPIKSMEERITALEERLDACRACTLPRP